MTNGPFSKRREERFRIAALFNSLPQVFRDRAILAGGALRAFHDGTPVKDYDFFFRNAVDYNVCADELNSGVHQSSDPAPKTFHAMHEGKLLNLIGFRFGTPEEIIAKFDFVCCMHAAWYHAAWYHPAGSLQVIHGEFSRYDAERKILMLNAYEARHIMEQREAHYVHDYGYTSCIRDYERERCAAISATWSQSGNSNG